MLEKLRIQNFKGWEDTGSIRMAPITLLFGKNSSGKSSIGHFLMLLKQTVESADRKAVLFPGDRNSVLQLGSYGDMVYRRDARKRILFEYQWSLQESMKFKDPIGGKNYACDMLSFSAKIGSGGDRKMPIVELFEYELGNGTVKVRMKKANSKYSLKMTGYDLKYTQGRPSSHLSLVRFYGFPDEVIACYKNADFVRQLNLQHEQLFDSLFYLGPLRTKAERLYNWYGIEWDGVGYSGEYTVPALLAAKSRKLSFGKGKRSKLMGDIIADYLQQLGLLNEFKIEPVARDRQEYEVKVCARGSKDPVDLPDVGFGISQVLPVLVQCFCAPRGSIVFMEQPELHLHPSAQAELADVMIDVIRSREDAKERQIQLIIETHSEHFLRRLQLRVAEGKVSEEDVAVYFADVDSGKAVLKPLELDRYGHIRNWPQHFFGDQMGDVVAHSKEAIARQREDLLVEKEKHEGD